MPAAVASVSSWDRSDSPRRHSDQEILPTRHPIFAFVLNVLYGPLVDDFGLVGLATVP